MKLEKLTVAEALAQGYDRCGYDNRDWQHLMDIKDLSEDDWHRYNGGKIVIADTKNPVTYSIDADDVIDMITDKIDEQEDINDEDGQMIEYLDEYKDLKADLQPIIDKINALIGKHEVFYLTDIELVP